jgi:hypothetical protein
MDDSRVKKTKIGKIFFTLFSLSPKVGVPIADVSGT